jgi:hypothetical protein
MALLQLLVMFNEALLSTRKTEHSRFALARFRSRVAISSHACSRPALGALPPYHDS